MTKFQNVWNEQMAKNHDESDETQSEYYDSESKRSRRQKSLTMPGCRNTYNEYFKKIANCMNFTRLLQTQTIKYFKKFVNHCQVTFYF